MVTTQRKEEFSAQAAPELLAALREIAQGRGCDFEAVLEDAMRHYVESETAEGPRPEVMAHYRASVEKNRRLAELLAQ